jgi:heavy metal translocating P-type ATPase
MTAACDYCGLPVAGSGSPAGGEAPASVLAAPVFCCSGCRFAASITGASGDDARARWMMTRLGLAIFFTMNVMVFTMLLWSQQDGLAVDTAGPAAVAFYALARHACLLFTAPVLLLLGGPLLDETVAELRRGRASLNLLLLTGVAAAFAISAWATWRGDGHVYFEVACMVLVAVTLGRWLEASGKLRTTAALRELRTLLPDRVRRVAGTTAAGGWTTCEVPLASVTVGDRLRILPGEHLPTDGRIVSGEAAIDERTVTGESEPVLKQAAGTLQSGVVQSDIVHSGTCNLDGDLVVEVTAPPGAGTLERLIAAVEAAAGGGRQQRLAERLSAWFLPLVLAVAAGTTVVHWRQAGPAAGVLTGLAVVVVSCPCALGLATPLALWAAVGAATRRHVLVRDGDALDRLAAADVVCFDKTGTITTGCRVTDVVEIEDGMIEDGASPAPTDLVAVAAALAAGSTHVHATAILAAAAAAGVVPAAVSGIRTVAGSGVEGRLEDGQSVRLGSPRWTGWQPVSGEEVEPPRVVLAVAGAPRLAFRIAEEVRPEAGPAVAALMAIGCAARMLSGDRAERARAVAEPLGLAWEAPLLPAEKLAAIERLTAAGRHVVMVGDGINDAPALAVADVGVALGCGADVSRWTAAVCLLRDDLSALPWLVQLGRETRRTIRWNLLWAFGYNAACIPLAAAGLVHPAVAAAAMVASSLLVVGNSLRLGSLAEADPAIATGRRVVPAAPHVSEVAA